MVFGRSKKQVNGKYVVAAVFRGTSSVADVISDIKAEPGGFLEAGLNSVKKLKAYLASEDHDFQPEEYTFKSPVRIPNNNPLSRNHLPYTYMALIMAEVPDKIADAYISF